MVLMEIGLWKRRKAESEIFRLRENKKKEWRALRDSNLRRLAGVSEAKLNGSPQPKS
jgi:hypothetical protein